MASSERAKRRLSSAMRTLTASILNNTIVGRAALQP